MLFNFESLFCSLKTDQGYYNGANLFVAVMILLSLTRDPLWKLILMNTFHGSGNLMYFFQTRFSDILYVMTLLR